MTDIAALCASIAEALEKSAPPKIEGGSDARQQWIADILAVEIGFHEVGLLDEFAAAMNARYGE